MDVPGNVSTPAMITVGGSFTDEAGVLGSHDRIRPDLAAGVSPADPPDTIDWGGVRVPGASVDGTTVNVYFAPAGQSFDGYTSEGFTSYEQSRFLDAFSLISDLTNVAFTVVASAARAVFRLVLDTNEVNGEFLGYFNPPGEFNAGVGVFDGTAWDRTGGAGSDLERGGYGFVTIVHELLHGLGLAHPHDNGGGSAIMSGVGDPFDDYGTWQMNQGIYTVMSYNSGYLTGPPGSAPASDNTYGYEGGPMALDIAVLQQKYGANPATNLGDTVYVLPTGNAAGTCWKAIWDFGGSDEIRAPGSADAVIDLRPASLLDDVGGGGFISAVSGIAGGFTIAAGVMIERATGGSGNDQLIGNDGANTLDGGIGADSMQGGLGNDFYVVDDIGDVISAEIAYSLGGGIDTVRAFVDYVAPNNIELVRVGNLSDTDNRNATGNDAPGTLVGNAGNNVLTGRGGDDQIVGNDGNDTLIGNTGRDTLVGGNGADTFVFTAIADSRAGAASRDFINGFEHGSDRIDLSAIDADPFRGGDQAFAYIGTRAFDGLGAISAGQLRTQHLGGPSAILVEGDHNGDGVADFQIFVNQTTFMTGSDFIL